VSRHYDVIVLGRSLGALSTAALLARRDFRVLLLGQGQKPPTYAYERHVLARRAFTLLVGSSPAWRRILHELAQSPRFRRRAQSLDPMFVVLMEGRRVEIAPDLELFAREVDREFPEVRQLVDELYATFAQVNAAADTAFERDCVWPPGSFWERLETGRAAAQLPFTGAAAQHDLLGKFPQAHPFRQIVLVPALFATALSAASDQLPPFALARLHGAWTRGVSTLALGEQELSDFLTERLEAHGGECRLGQRARALVIQRGSVVGVLEDGEEEPTGCDIVVCDQPGEHLADLAGGEGITKRARLDWPRVTPNAGRFVVTMIVASQGLPAPLSEESFLIAGSRGRADPRRPVVHLQRFAASLRSEEPAARSETLLVAETLLPTRGPLTLLEARDAVLATLIERLPFIERHLLVVDSPHDGLPLWDLTTGARKEIDRIHIPEATPGGEPMQWQWAVDPPGWLDLAGEPIRGPIAGTFLVGPSVLPALGQEGELIAAWGAARIITRKDRTRQKMRRHMWTKIET
jgi:phytoene dehydrogenase-like protein